MTTNSVNYTNVNIDKTVRIFDQFFDFDINVPAAEYDIVYSFFLREMQDRQVAANFAQSLFQVAANTNVPALTLLESFKGQSGLELTVAMSYYLNQIRSRATLLGVGVPVTPNSYAARNVLT